MNAPYCPWTAAEPLRDLTLWYDWDPVAGMIASLRIYLFEHGAIPTWNYLICAGRPELGTPFSWGWTWPSLFAYALPPNSAIVAVWIVLTAAGALAMRSLLLGWSGSRLGAAVGACLWACNGYFATRFNVGHVTFAFFHLVPVLLLVTDRALASILSGERRSGPLLLLALTSFLFFTAGLPHALLHLYPAWLLFVAVRAWQVGRRAGWSVSLRASALLGASHLLGLWLAAYKLWPVIRWQQQHPRGDVLGEAYPLGRVFANTLDFVPDYFGTYYSEAWQVYPVWEYNAFVGVVPWLLAGVAAAAATRRQLGTRPRAASDPGMTGFGLALVVVGLLLSLGNEHPWSPARLFAGLPLLEGVRAFSRYQALTLLGLCVLSAQALASLRPSGWLPWRGPLAAGVCAPALAQTALLAWNLHAVPERDIRARHDVEERAQPPQLAAIPEQMVRRTFHQKVLLEQGYWVTNCPGSLVLPERAPLQPMERAELSRPPPERLVALGLDSVTLEYGAEGSDHILLQIPVLESFTVTPAPIARRDGHAILRRADLPEGMLRVVGAHPGPSEGAWASLAGLLVAASALAAWHRVHR